MRYVGIKRLFVSSFLGILVLTALSSTLAVGGIFYMMQREGRQLPKVEQQVQDLQQYARQNVGGLLSNNTAERRDWETRVRSADEVTYGVLDAQGRLLYGDASNFAPSLPVDRLAEQLNTIQVNGEDREETIALVRNGGVEGYLILEYPLANSALSLTQRVQLVTQLGLAALLPIIFLIASTLLFAWRLGRRLNEPIGELRSAVERIRRRDLDFTIHYDEPDELGDLCRAFSDLRTELQESLEREWRQGQEIREMVASLSHDLRTPATVIQGHVEGLMRAGEKRAERLDRYLPVIEASSSRMVKLLNDMMLVVTLEQTGFSIRPEPVDLAGELGRKAEVYALRTSERGVAFDLEIPGPTDTLERTVELDVHRFEQVLDNLFENALSFTPPGGTVTLSATRDDHELEVSIRDTGPGIASEDLPRIFDRFYRGVDQQARSGASSGLGLYISKLLVEAQGGCLTVRNHPAGGCEARFSLRLTDEAQAPSPLSPTLH